MDKDERRKQEIIKARQIMAQLLGGNRVKFGPLQEHEDKLATRRRARFRKVGRRSARRESLKRFRRRLWNHASLRGFSRRQKRAILKRWWKDDARKQAGRL